MRMYRLSGVDVLVSPVDGEELPDPQLGLSAGFQHYVDQHGELVGYCGVSIWEENAVETTLDREPKYSQPRIVCAANRLDETIVLGARHFDSRMHATIQAMRALGDERKWGGSEQGFIDQFGKWHDRETALLIAREAGQLEGRTKTGSANSDELFSEDLY